MIRTDTTPVRLDRPRKAAGADAAGQKNMQQLIQLRWFAVIGQIVTILTVHFVFEIQLPLRGMSLTLALLVAFNIASLLRWRGERPVSERAVFIALLVDVAVLSVQLYFSGGASNPFVSLYLLQVVLSAVLLHRHYSWSLVAITTLCFVALTQWHQPLMIPPRDQSEGIGDPYALGVLVCFALNAVLLVVVVTRITRNLRARDSHLADLRQRAAEEEHIVRMGLLASGAAHELSTPLSTLSVILGDWHHMRPFKSNPELLQELEEMQAQLMRCKTIVTGILLSAGEDRGEAPKPTTVAGFLDDLVAEWRGTRSATALSYRNDFGDDLAIVSDSALKQTLHNVLDNAIEASPIGISLAASREGERLVLEVTDNGPGFDPEMLERLGKPYQSSKERPGSGLGLFLVVNVVRKLGGSVSAGNRAEGGAKVTLSLPLSAIKHDG